MPDFDYSLNLFTSVLGGASPAPVPGWSKDDAVGWRRSIRLQGNYWLGSFHYFGLSDGDVLEFFHTQLDGHLVERSGGRVSWEGLIAEMDLARTKNSRTRRGRYFLDVTAAGYIHTANDRFVSVGDDSVGNASDWVESIITTDCADWLLVGEIAANTTSVLKRVKIERRGWEELLRIAQLGDSTGVPWVIQCGINRKMYYYALSATPTFISRGGIKYRRSRSLVFNHVSGTYFDQNSDLKSLAAATNDISIEQHGRREHHILIDGMPDAGVQARRDTFLKENAWAYPRAIGADRGAELFLRNGEQANPYLVKPGVVRDLDYPVGGAVSGGFLGDARDCIIEEVEVGPGGELSLRTALFEEADLLEAREDMESEIESFREERSLKKKGAAK